MPLLLIGHSLQELQLEYARGASAARLESQQSVYAVLARLMPELRWGHDPNDLPQMSEMLARLEKTWQTTLEPERQRLRQLEMDKSELQQQVKRQAEELTEVHAANWPEQVRWLYQQVGELRLERDQAQADLQKLRQETADQLHALDAELDQADTLVVKYETQDLQRKAKTRG